MTRDPDDEQHIRERAYLLWVEEGKPEGKAAVHWELAKLLNEMHERRISVHAYNIRLDEGKPEGKAQEHWERARFEVDEEDAMTHGDDELTPADGRLF